MQHLISQKATLPSHPVIPAVHGPGSQLWLYAPAKLEVYRSCLLFSLSFSVNLSTNQMENNICQIIFLNHINALFVNKLNKSCLSQIELVLFWGLGCHQKLQLCPPPIPRHTLRIPGNFVKHRKRWPRVGHKKIICYNRVRYSRSEQYLFYSVSLQYWEKTMHLLKLAWGGSNSISGSY